jgi:Phytanoyl-CoA dioxygenase (PhyH)
MTMSVGDPHIKRYPGADPLAFQKRGYAVVRQIFDIDEAARLREAVLELLAKQEGEGRVAMDTGAEGTTRRGEGDLLSNPELRHVLLDRRLIEAVGDLLGGKPTYFGESSFQAGNNGLRNWHRDKVGRRWLGGPDWRGPFLMVRCGLYLQDGSRHSGGLALRPGSHQPGLVRPTLPKLLDARLGDLIVWNLRTVHAAEVVRMRGLSGFPLHPSLQTLLPQRLRVPADGERVVIFMAFALPGPHLDGFLAYLRSSDFAPRGWARSRFGPDVWAEAESAGLNMLRPAPVYGTPPDGADTTASGTGASADRCQLENRIPDVLRTCSQMSSRTASTTRNCPSSVRAGKQGSDRQPA